jgi:nucleoside-diphosphate-sugar epimerase
VDERSGQASELHVVLGASGGVGGAVVRELAGHGRRVRAVSRGGRGEASAGVEWAAADVGRPEQARAACAGAAVVFFCANPPYERWARDFPPLLDGAIAGASAAGARLVFADNLYVYAPTPHPLTEDLPWEPVTRKGRVRKRMDETLMAAHRAGTVRAAIGRASDYYGPGGPNSAVGERFFGQLLAGRPVQWLGRLDVPHTLAFIDDFARGLVTLGEREEALGQVWHIPAAEPLTGRQFITLAAEEAGVAPRMASVGPLALRLAGLFLSPAREMVEMRYEFEEPYLVDAGKFARAFGGTPTPHREALRATIAWYGGHTGVRGDPGA